MEKPEPLAPGIAMFLAFAGLFAGLSGWWSNRENVKKILNLHVDGSPELTGLQELLTLANEASGKIFSNGPAANVVFRGRLVTVVHGRVGQAGGGKSGPGWVSNLELFAVAPPDSVEWMLRQQDVFTPIYKGEAPLVY